jgi:hypothetical protein
MNKSPFPSIPVGSKIRINTSSRRLAAWKAMESVFASGVKPDDFGKAYSLCSPVCGQYKDEAESLWRFIRGNEIHSIAEVGRNLGGNIFLLSCAAKELKTFLSVDLLYWSLTDDIIPDWWRKNGVDGTLCVCDSMKYMIPRELELKNWDFVYIDGGHTGEIVKADIEFWKDKTRFIGFHDFADKGSKNCHRKVFKGIVKEIQDARDKYGWVQFGDRANSEIVFRTNND